MKKYLILAVNRTGTNNAITKSIKTLLLPKAIIPILFLIGMLIFDIGLTMIKARAKNEKQKEKIIFLQKAIMFFMIAMLIYVIFMAIIVGLKLAA